ncbi:MAG TPA: EF-hand domain-containing protein [Streptomyces sp.]|nr:EF-hand domain-containing protein [Streptomyces sp.]
MSTDVANARLAKRFDKWDTDGNGVLEAGDLQGEAARIADNLGKAGTPEALELQKAFQGLYDVLAEQSGADSGISREQFLSAAGDLLFEQGEAAFNRALGPVVKALIGLCDDNHDGEIDGGEFQSWLTAIGVADTEASEAFAKVDANGDGRLSEEELLTAVREFHFGRLEVELLG